MNRVTTVTLGQFVEGLHSDRILYIGSKTGYFFIGTITEYAEMIDELSAKYHALAENGEINSIIDLKRYSSSLKKAAELSETEPEGIEKMLEIANDIGNASKRNAHYKKVLREWVDFPEREVLESYDKKWCEEDAGETEPGLAIILRGTENGPYWMKSEWDFDRSKIGSV